METPDLFHYALVTLERFREEIDRRNETRIRERRISVSERFPRRRGSDPRTRARRLGESTVPALRVSKNLRNIGLLSNSIPGKQLMRDWNKQTLS